MLGILDNKLGDALRLGENKDLQRLSRQDLLELLISQMHEADDLRATQEKNEQTIAEFERLTEHLKSRLDAKDERQEGLKEKLALKDEQISHLKARLDDKDASIKKLKRRLDAKDELIAHLIDGELTAEDELGIFEMRARAREAIEAEESRRADAALEGTARSESEGDEDASGTE